MRTSEQTKAKTSHHAASSCLCLARPFRVKRRQEQRTLICSFGQTAEVTRLQPWFSSALMSVSPNGSRAAYNEASAGFC